MVSLEFAKKFARDERGSISVTAAGILLAAMVATGVAVDYGRIASKKGDLQSAVDAMETNALSLALQDKRYETRALELIQVNYEATALELSKELNDARTFAIVSDKVPTTILGLLGQTELTVSASREIPSGRLDPNCSDCGNATKPDRGTKGRTVTTPKPQRSGENKEGLSRKFKQRLQNGRSSGEQIAALNRALRQLDSMRSSLPEDQYRLAKRRIKALRAELSGS